LSGGSVGAYLERAGSGTRPTRDTSPPRGKSPDQTLTLWSAPERSPTRDLPQDLPGQARRPIN